MNFLAGISHLKRSLVIILVILVVAISFETLQQLYYIKRYQIADDVSFLELLKNHAYRWLIWLLLSVFLILYVKKSTESNELNLKDFVGYTAVIIGLVILNITIISSIQFITVESEFSLSVFSEYFQFYTFQKAPIYTLGYIAITIILQFLFTNEKLQVQVQELSQIKSINEKLYNQLSQDLDDKTSILNIKIGNKRKIIPIHEILWIEADDYCVKVHTIKEKSYTMRSSLKMLQENLDGNFLRVHRKAIVNMDMAKEFNLSQQPKLLLNNNVQIPVSKSHLKHVKSFLS